jgi:hypothetical protein
MFFLLLHSFQILQLIPIVEKNDSRIGIPVMPSMNGIITKPIIVIGPATPIGRVAATMYEKTIV